MRTTMRSHPCGALRIAHVGQQVELGGWVHRRRDLGGMVFFDLRDREGIVQVAFGPEWCTPTVLRAAGAIAAENVVLITGVVTARPLEAVNADLATGEIEVRATAVRVVGPAQTPAIPVWRARGEELPSEELRLEYRFLDLRRPEMQRNLMLRHRLLQCARRTLADLGFLEIETPILTKPTPEGARDYLIPSRVHRGQFYALPQSPQIYKQVLMASGFDRYFQIARCFRDEDLRADRQPEFTQIDVEASFVTDQDVFAAMEAVVTALWAEGGHPVSAPFPRMSFRDAMERFGTDKPDLRYGLELQDLGALLGGKGFSAFDGALQQGVGGRIRGIRVPDGAELTRKQTDQLAEVAKAEGLGGLALLKRRGDELSGPLARLPGVDAETAALPDGGLLLAAAGSDEVTSRALDRVRRSLLTMLALEPEQQHAFAWVIAFPLFERSEDGTGWTFAHHPFTAPASEDLERFQAGDAEHVRAQHYDLVYNGNELGSGSIRISDPAIQLRVLDLLGITADEAERRFGFLLQALRGGAPPHGGMALGFDRIVMLLAGADNLREVIAFPKTTAARALFEDAPTCIPERDLAALGLRVTE